MGIRIVVGDLFEQKVDAIVIPSAPNLQLEGAIGGRAVRICGRPLFEDLDKLDFINFFECAFTKAYNLPCKHLILVANPKWFGGRDCEEGNLTDSYRSVLETVISNKLKSVAFPLLSSGSYSFKKSFAIRVALEAIEDYLEETKKDLDVVLVIWGRTTFKNNKHLFTKYKVTFENVSEEAENDARVCVMDRNIWYRKTSFDHLEGYFSGDKTKLRVVMNGLIVGHGISTHKEIYTGIMSKTAFENMLSEKELYYPPRDTLLALCLRMRLSLKEINEVLKTINSFFPDEIGYRDKIILKAYNKYQKYDDLLECVNQSLIHHGFGPLTNNK